jgi:hypothetical protein
MLNLIRNESNHVIAGFIHEGINDTKCCDDSINKLAMHHDLRNFSLFKLEGFANELYKKGFISFIEYAILNFQFKQNSCNDQVMVCIFNDNIDRDFNINLIKIWEEYLEECDINQDNIPFVNIIRALLKKIRYLEDIKFKYKKLI